MVCAWLGTATLALKNRAKDDRVRGLLDRLSYVTKMYVRSFDQTEVAMLKVAKGTDSPGGEKITADEWREIFMSCHKEIREHFGGDFEILRKLAFGGNEEKVMAHISHGIESAVHELKAEKSLLGGAVAPVATLPRGLPSER